MLEELISKILDQLFSTSYRNLQEKKEADKRRKEAQTALMKLLEPERESEYYNSFDRLLSETRLVESLMNGRTLAYSNTDFESRVGEHIEKLNIDSKHKSRITDVAVRVLETL